MSQRRLPDNTEHLSWDAYFVEMAKLVATKSKDKTTKVGCVVVGPNNEIRSTGYNGFPRGINDLVPERYERTEKLFWTEHSERNALYNAARMGSSLEGCRIYVTMFPCMDCARGIIQCGIVEVTAPKPDFANERWGQIFERAVLLLEEAGIRVNYTRGEVICV